MFYVVVKVASISRSAAAVWLIHVSGDCSSLHKHCCTRAHTHTLERELSGTSIVTSHVQYLLDLNLEHNLYSCQLRATPYSQSHTPEGSDQFVSTHGLFVALKCKNNFSPRQNGSGDSPESQSFHRRAECSSSPLEDTPQHTHTFSHHVFSSHSISLFITGVNENCTN